MQTNINTHKIKSKQYLEWRLWIEDWRRNKGKKGEEREERKIIQIHTNISHDYSNYLWPLKGFPWQVNEWIWHAGKRAAQLRTLTAFPEDPRSVPSTPLKPLITACNSSSRGSTAVFWPPRALHISGAYSHIHTNKNKYGISKHGIGIQYNISVVKRKKEWTVGSGTVKKFNCILATERS